MNNKNSSNIQKSLAGGVLSQRDPMKQTGTKMEDKASQVLQSNKYSDISGELTFTI